MRWSRSPVTAALIGACLLVACAPAASPEPATSPMPSASTATSSAPVPTATPLEPPSRAASEWPFALEGTNAVELGPDGTAYIMADGPEGGQRSVVALDSGGRVTMRWPLAPTTDYELVSHAIGPDGSPYVTECGAFKGCLLHRLDATGRDAAGWPFEVPADLACRDEDRWCYVEAQVRSSGGAWISAHGHQSGALDLIAVDEHGATVPGWPVEIDGERWWSYQTLAPDGTVFLVSRPIGTPTFEAGRKVDSGAELWAFDADGEPRAGWPVPVPDIGGYWLAPSGNVVVGSLLDNREELCASPRRTVFTVLGPDGHTLPGWPRGSTGYASAPVVAEDGTLYYITAAGNLYGHDSRGEVKPGWPAAIPGAVNSGCGQAAPLLSPDGSIYAVGDEITARSPDGRLRPGWPYVPDGKLTWPCLDTDCPGHSTRPVFGADGTVYFVTYGSNATEAWFDVVALSREGRLVPGWPYRLPIDPTIDELELTVSPNDRLFVRSQRILLALDPAGQLAK
jgi:hypothetical protein